MNKKFFAIIVCLCCIGCGESKPQAQAISEPISATILLPSKKPLSNQKIILMPTELYGTASELYGTARPVIAHTDENGLFKTDNAKFAVYPISYKIYVILKSRTHKKYLPSKYYDREDDESDLILDMKIVSGGCTLRMNNK
jgi:hypothetical protein